MRFPPWQRKLVHCHTVTDKRRNNSFKVQGSDQKHPTGTKESRPGHQTKLESFGFAGVCCPIVFWTRNQSEPVLPRTRLELPFTSSITTSPSRTSPPAPCCPRDIHKVKNVSGALPKQTQALYGFINYTPFPLNFSPLPSALSIHRLPGDLLTKHPAQRSRGRRELLLLPSLPAIS